MKVTVSPTQIVVALAEMDMEAGRLGLTVMFTVDVAAAHGLIPVVVKVNTAVPL